MANCHLYTSPNPFSYTFRTCPILFFFVYIFFPFTYPVLSSRDLITVQDISHYIHSVWAAWLTSWSALFLPFFSSSYSAVLGIWGTDEVQ
ncbi:hypothetical protein B0J18DRAFT_432127 [Chaetomium sp. MPI-SDFR-AT-0129]|nr:hypothetical protein B0J18DRAFT_432127 [Chaetomium sp. MPI-SDFR-AT-0129]